MKEGKGQDFIIVAMVIDDIDSFDDVRVLEGRAHAELCGDLFLVLLLGLPRTLCTKLLDSVDRAAILSLDETNGTSCAAAEDLAPLAILFSDVGMGGLVERSDWMVAWLRAGRRPGL